MMKKIFGILLLLLLVGCNDIYRTKTVGINEELYIKGISRVAGIGGRSPSYPRMRYYVGTLLGKDTIFIIEGNPMKNGDTLEYKLGDRITLKKLNE